MTTPPLRRTIAAKAIDLPPGYPAVEELMRALSKAVRAQQLYMQNNPNYRTAIENVRAAFLAVWREHAELVLAVTETELRWLDVTVMGDASKSSDSLAWLFYKDGIRELRFLKGVEDTDLVRFIDIVARARKATVDNDDLITMLWEADLTGLTYQYVDLQADGGDTPRDDDGFASMAAGGAAASPEAIREGAQQAATSPKPAGVVNMADFDATLHFLDEREADYLRREIEREYSQDLRINIVAGLLDIFEQQEAEAVREEVLDHVETMLAFMLASGSFRGVAFLLRETTAASTRAVELTPEIRARVSTLSDRLSSPPAIDQLLDSLDSAAALPPEDELAELFDQLRPEALGTVFRWLPRLRSDDLRGLVTDVADRLAVGNIAEIIRLIEAADVDVSSEAVRRAGGLKAQAAVTAIGRVCGDPDPRRRLIAAQALAEIGSIGALQALERCVADSDRDVRIVAARSLASRGHRPALARLEPIIKGKEIRAADVTEKTAFFESYGAVCGDSGVPNLDAILNSKGFLGKREDPDLRAAAAAGLARIATAKARESLQRAAADKDAVVRNAVARALRGSAA